MEVHVHNYSFCLLQSKGRGRVLSDSDSDLEDFQNVVSESVKALTFTENALYKQRKDPMESGIVLDPAEYVRQHVLYYDVIDLFKCKKMIGDNRRIFR